MGVVWWTHFSGSVWTYKEKKLEFLFKASTIMVGTGTVETTGVKENNTGVFWESMKDRKRDLELVQSRTGAV